MPLLALQIPQPAKGALAAEMHVTDIQGDLWSIDRHSIRQHHLDVLKDIYSQTDSQVQKDFLEDLHCLLKIDRNADLLMIKVTNAYVEYQEKVKFQLQWR